MLSDIEEENDLELKGADPFLMLPSIIDTVSYHSLAVPFKGKDDGGGTKDQKETNKQQQVCLFT